MTTKTNERSKIAADIDSFLGDGNMITQLPYDPSAENAARVGRWQLLGGDELFEDLVPRKYGEDLIDHIHDDDLRLNEQERDYAIEQAMTDSHDYFSIDEQEEW